MWRNAGNRPMPAPSTSSLAGWYKWLFVIAMPVLVLSFEIRMNVETTRRDYKTAVLDAKIKQLTETLDSLKVEAARLQNMDRVEIEAPDLGLVPPEPNQIRVIYCDEPEPAPHQHPLGAELLQAQTQTEDIQSGGSQQESWNTNSPIGQNQKNDVMVRLRTVIAAAYASYFGHS